MLHENVLFKQFPWLLFSQECQGIISSPWFQARTCICILCIQLLMQAACNSSKYARWDYGILFQHVHACRFQTPYDAVCRPHRLAISHHVHFLLCAYHRLWSSCMLDYPDICATENHDSSSSHWESSIICYTLCLSHQLCFLNQARRMLSLFGARDQTWLNNNIIMPQWASDLMQSPAKLVVRHSNSTGRESRYWKSNATLIDNDCVVMVFNLQACDSWNMLDHNSYITHDNALVKRCCHTWTCTICLTQNSQIRWLIQWWLHVWVSKVIFL